jgi:arsenite-transporting ATPase
MTADQVIVNRLLPDVGDVGGYFAGWLSQQSAYVEEIREYFQPVPVATLPMFPQEVVGQPRLRDVAAALYGETDPAGRYLAAPPYRFGKDGGAFWLRLSLPFVQKDELEINRVDEDLIIRLGAFKRYVPLPRSVQRLKVSRAKMEEGELYLELAEIGSAVDGPMRPEDTP